MTIDLPPRRELPADVKERMRPDFTEPSRRRNHAPYAVAAGVALLVAGGVAVTQSITDTDADPARSRVVSPSALDVNRCRAALGDENWRSTEMVVFAGHKVLIGQDTRFCELTRAKAFVAAGSPVRLEAGTITYRSERIIAGIPPLGALKARAREATGTYTRASTDAVTTADFFVIHTSVPINITEMVFDDRTVKLDADADLPRATGVDSFETGDGDPTTTANRLAKCLDGAAATTPEAAQGNWTAITSAGFDAAQTGAIIARRDDDQTKLGLCRVVSDSGSLAIQSIDANESRVQVLGYAGTPDRLFIAGHTTRRARSVELSFRDRSVIASVTDGVFIAEVPSGHTDIAVSPVTAIVKDEKYSVLWSGTPR